MRAGGTERKLEPSHTGFITRDLESSMEALSILFGVDWMDIQSHSVPPGTAGFFGDQLSTRMAYSVPGPWQLEVIQGPPGSIWQTDALVEMHHVCYWSSDVPADISAFQSRGWSTKAVWSTGTVLIARDDCLIVELMPTDRRGGRR